MDGGAEQGVLALSGVWEPPPRGWAHLEADLEVLTVLAAATELAAETLVDVAATLVGAVAAVILAIAEQRLGHAAPAAAQELRGGVALVLCGGRVWLVSRLRADGERGQWVATRRAHLGWCSAGSWAPHRSGRGNHSRRHTPTGESSDSARWRSGTHWGRRSGTLGEGGTVRLGHGARALSRPLPPPTLARDSPHSGDSSEPSAQSRSWSHTKCLGMHWRFWHMNSRSSQVLLYTADRWRRLSPAPPAAECPLPGPAAVRGVERAERKRAVWVTELEL